MTYIKFLHFFYKSHSSLASERSISKLSFDCHYLWKLFSQIFLRSCSHHSRWGSFQVIFLLLIPLPKDNHLYFARIVWCICLFLINRTQRNSLLGCRYLSGQHISTFHNLLLLLLIVALVWNRSIFLWSLHHRCHCSNTLSIL